MCSFFISTRLFFHQVACNLYIISRKTAYHQLEELYIISRKTAYHQLEELHIIKPKRIVFMHGRAVMIYRRKRPMIYKDVPSLMICQTTLRFGLDKKISTKTSRIFWRKWRDNAVSRRSREPLGVFPRASTLFDNNKLCFRSVTRTSRDFNYLLIKILANRRRFDHNLYYFLLSRECS